MIPVRYRRRVRSAAQRSSSAAARDGGYGWLPDLELSDIIPGVGAVPLNIVDGIRIGPGAAFLEPALSRPNLTVLTGTRVTRVRTAGGRPSAWRPSGPSGPVRIDADRVVLSAGAIASAHLLMLSGIGPADDLAALGIPPVADLPVGQRTWDHPEVGDDHRLGHAIPVIRCWKPCWWSTAWRSVRTQRDSAAGTPGASGCR